MSAQGPPTPPIWLLPEPPERRWGLGRAEIVRAAVALADAGGADALTMRAVATALGSSTPMSLYRYVHSKDGLVDLMLTPRARRSRRRSSRATTGAAS